ncbi:hypothetical protein MFUM_570005 [Methylacidiphilum fumariolicum SolV]|uniref:Uncharacterized protein n=2 Tax=Candidatus Methylacidiphilum fumarolicum TaxID=591154 RepID=I0JYH1_METFB|nr:conserved protein of unknown function [Candidatus Methylacidiphilum fumarolicum]CCG92290.1 hypothetical protein MFUM_570005 [Methylacidiphilum fumariolicum SolV]
MNKDKDAASKIVNDLFGKNPATWYHGRKEIQFCIVCIGYPACLI